VGPRTRVVLVTGGAAALAAALAVGFALLQSGGERSAEATPARPAGAPPLVLDLGVRDDPEARALRRASALLAGGRRAEARRAFAGRRSLQGRVGAAVASWPRGTLARLGRLARAEPLSGVVRLNLGLVLLWSGRRADAMAAWRAARRVEPDSLAAVRADDLLHPRSPPGLPAFLPSFSPPRQVISLPAPQQLAALERAASTGGARAKLLYGVALQRIGRPRSAERQFTAAAAAAPGSVEAQVAAAVGRFDKDRPERAFSRLGPLARRAGGNPSVRFHLGLLLLWIGEGGEARRQLAAARFVGRRSALGREAARYLRELDRASAP